MKICLILEGCYPYIHGGVSTWTHSYIQSMKEHEFVLWVVGAQEKEQGRFVYELPEHVTEIHEVFLDTALRKKDNAILHRHFNREEEQTLQALMDCGRPDWDILFRLFQDEGISPISFLRSEPFLQMLMKNCLEQHPYLAFSDAFHTIRSMLLPVLYLLGTNVPRADLYHAVCTGYGGILGALGSWKYQVPLLLTEHGIYTREREEEIIRAKWVADAFRKKWIRFFYMLSDVAYQRAFRVTSLFRSAMQAQIELGCDSAKCRVIENGISCERFAGILPKEEDGWIDIGAVVRLAPIKDIKTMLYAFYELSVRVKNVRLHIMGGVDKRKYAEECYELVKKLELENVVFTGRVDIAEYMKKLDFTILTSISEGQPLSVLESLAAGRPCVTTDVGCCRELLEGKEGDMFDPAGYCVPPMHREGLTDAMEKMCASRSRRLHMGRAGQLRVRAEYRQEQMTAKYRTLYQEVEDTHGGNRI